MGPSDRKRGLEFLPKCLSPGLRKICTRMSVQTIHNVLSVKTGHWLSDDQIVNHFPQHYELTHEDLMVKNIKRYRRRWRRKGARWRRRAKAGRTSAWTVSPSPTCCPPTTTCSWRGSGKAPRVPGSWNLWQSPGKGHLPGQQALADLKMVPGEQNIFVRDSAHQGSLRDLCTVTTRSWSPAGSWACACASACRPLRCSRHKPGLGHFCAVKCTPSTSELDSMCVRLTSVAIQKPGEGYHHIRGRVDRAHPAALPGEHPRRGGDPRAAWGAPRDQRAVPEGPGAREEPRRALLWVLRIRHHHRRQAEAPADGG